MDNEIYIDLEVLAEVEDDEYLVRISKKDLNTLILSYNSLVVRHWDGKHALVLEPYGETTIRTRGDDSVSNNFVRLPRLRDEDLSKLTNS